MDFSEGNGYDRSLVAGARAAVRDVLALKKGETIFIVTNPNRNVREISMAIFDAAVEAGAAPVLAFQAEKGQFDFTEETIVKAMHAEPDVLLSISTDKIGKDKVGLIKGYPGKRKYSSIFEKLYEEKTSRAFWSPGVTKDMWRRTVPIDYTRLRSDCRKVMRHLNASSSVRVTAPGGTDITIGLKGRKAKLDDGDFRRPGSAGNVPSGEVYVSPELGTASGVIAFDGSIALSEDEIVIRNPIVAEVSGGFIAKLSGGSEAKALRSSIAAGRSNARRMVSKGELPKKDLESYVKNAAAIGELGIGLNRRAKIVANMLEDEKVYGTCHFAVGSNYDGDAESLIHLDGIVKRPTITVMTSSGRETVVMDSGRLVWD
ncbi:MAG: aminopeptidase [Thermoplasmata archaeon]